MASYGFNVRKLTYLYITAVTYGSLYPFNFVFLSPEQDNWLQFLTNLSLFNSLGDLIANLVLFIPLGYFAIEHLNSSSRRNRYFIQAFLFGTFFALFLQIIQLYLPDRVASLADVFWNIIGMLGGLAFGISIKTLAPKFSIANQANVPLVLSLFWFGYILFPFIPTIDFQVMKESLKPVILKPQHDISSSLTIAASWLAITHFAQNIFIDIKIRRLFLPFAFGLTILLRIIILENHIDLSDLIGGLTAIFLWCLYFQNSHRRLEILTLLFGTAILFNGLDSLQFSTYEISFSWIPFSGFLEGNLFTSSKTLLFKLFLYGTFIWLLKNTSSISQVGFEFVALFFLCISIIEIIQAFMPLHTAEITDPILILLLSMLLKSPKQDYQGSFKSLKDKTNKPPEVNAPISIAVSEAHSTKLPILQLVLTTSIIVALISLVLEIPDIPYNLKELFLLDGFFISIIPFAAFILWYGMSVPLITHKTISTTRLQFVWFPIMVFASGIICYLLLKLSITKEAMNDITGSSNVYWYVVNKDIWGIFGHTLANAITSTYIWSAIEEIVRFLALISPMTFILGIFNISLTYTNKHKTLDTPNKTGFYLRVFGKYFAYSLPWLYLCKLITFDLSSTDNLNELIAKTGFLGLGGGGYIYLLAILIALNTTQLAMAKKVAFYAVFTTLCASIIAWFLLNLGLETHVHKYGSIFSGIDFLIGPDRNNLLPTKELLLRWIILYLFIVFLLVVGMRNKLFQMIFKFRPNTDKPIVEP